MPAKQQRLKAITAFFLILKVLNDLAVPEKLVFVLD